MTRRTEFDGAMDRLGALLGAVEQHVAPDALEATRGLVDAVMAVHREGLRGLLDELRDSPDGIHVLRRLAMRPEVEGLLLLHGMHPEPMEGRVRRAVREADVRAGKHGTVELVAVTAASAEVRLAIREPGERAGVRTFLEVRMGELAPDCELTVVEPERGAPNLVPLERLTARSAGQ